ncbi:MAG: ABC transporter permease [Acidobacteria bacterium]|nr:ABC transporter permease [Acidobacteriota bacterium]
MLQDLRYAVRSLRHAPLFVTISLLSLALGIGANTAIFTIADRVLFRSLPVAHAGELVQFTSPGPQSGMVWGENRFSYPMFRDLRDHNTVFAGIAGRFSTPLNLTYNNRSERVTAELVTGTYFGTLGLSTVLGRPLALDDDRLPGAHAVAVLTYDYWRRRFNGNPAILNQKVLLNGYPMTVVGVAAAGYHGFDVGERTDVLVPTMMKNQMTPTWKGLDDRRVIWLQLVGRFAAGVSGAQARASLEPYYHGLLIMEMQTMPFRSEQGRARFVSKPLIFVPAARGVSDLRDAFEQPILILLAIVGLLLLIACANVAGLLLARAVSRQREIAVRLAIGAGRWSLIRQLLAESLVLALAGGAAGVLLAWWIASALLAAAPEMAVNAEPDPRVLGFTFALSLVTGLVFGLVPAWRATSPGLAVTLKDQGGSVSSSRTHVRLRKALVIAQVAISLVMLIASALFTRSLSNLRAVDLGFVPDRLLTFGLDPSLGGYDATRNRGLAEELQARLLAIPGVRSAAIGVVTLVAGNQEMNTIAIEGYQPKPDEDMNPWFDTVSPGYFRTLEIPLVAGREFTAADRAGTPRVAIVNEAFARQYFKTVNALGRRFGLARGKGNEIEIVGVVRAAKYSTIDEKPHATAYLCYAQDDNPSSLVAYVRAAGNPKGLFGAIRREAAALAPALPVTDLRTMNEQVDASLATRRAMSYLSTLFAVLATVLAGVGLYGVMAYTVARRTREIGIRVALGAARGDLLAMVMREVAALTAIGVAAAIPTALMLSRYVRAQLYGIAPADPWSIGLASLVLVSIALLAGYVPAERATRVDPIRALRHE